MSIIARSKACIGSDRLNTGIAISISVRGTYMCPRFSVVLSFTGLAMARFSYYIPRSVVS
jgi:hypothetical protein